MLYLGSAIVDGLLYFFFFFFLLFNFFPTNIVVVFPVGGEYSLTLEKCRYYKTLNNINDNNDKIRIIINKNITYLCGMK